MIDKARKNFNKGMSRVKWFAGFLAERTKAETNVAKLLYESSKIEDRIDELYRDIGRRIIELQEKDQKEGKDVFKDFIIQKALDEIKNLKETVNDYKNQAKNINKLPE